MNRNRDEDLNAVMPFEIREEWLLDGKEPLAKTPTLVRVEISGQPNVALKWYGIDGSARRQFFFPVSMPQIPELERISIPEWSVIAIGPLLELKDKYQLAGQISEESELWGVVITINHNLTDLTGQQMYGRPHLAILATRLLGEESNFRNVTPEKYPG